MALDRDELYSFDADIEALKECPRKFILTFALE